MTPKVADKSVKALFVIVMVTFPPFATFHLLTRCSTVLERHDLSADIPQQQQTHGQRPHLQLTRPLC
jgi:hypothetical protein